MSVLSIKPEEVPFPSSHHLRSICCHVPWFLFSACSVHSAWNSEFLFVFLRFSPYMASSDSFSFTPTSCTSTFHCKIIFTYPLLPQEHKLCVDRDSVQFIFITQQIAQILTPSGRLANCNEWAVRAMVKQWSRAPKFCMWLAQLLSPWF